MIPLDVVASGLLIPEGPVPLADGSVLFVEVGAGRINRVSAEGRLEVLAQIDGGPNGAAIGPDGAAYICNNGGGFACELVDGQLQIGFAPERYVGGSIQRLDLATGAVTTFHTACDGQPLRAPNDIVFDRDGGFWFTDHGTSAPDGKQFGGIHHATIDGGSIRQARRHLLSPNGIGLSPDGAHLYWADTLTARVWRAEVVAPGQLADPAATPDTLVATVPGRIMLDSLAVEADGRICVGGIGMAGIGMGGANGKGCIVVIDPADGSCEHLPIDDTMVTNIAFGGDDGRDVWITAAGTGRLLCGRWPRPGLPLAFTA